MDGYYKCSINNPFHLSVGAVVINENRKICVHRFNDVVVMGIKLDDVKILMRETLHNDESLEKAAKRGLMEEFGIKGEILGFLGSIKSRIPKEGFSAEKTTIYFLTRMISMNTSKRSKEDIEGSSQMIWEDPKDLIKHMKAQGKKYGNDLDESEIIERALNFIQNL